MRSPVIAAAAAVAASAVTAVVMVTVPVSAAAGRQQQAPAIAGVWDEHTVQLAGPEKGLREHFQVVFYPGGGFVQVSGSAGDATALGTWGREDGKLVVSFDALNQDPGQDVDRFHVVLMDFRIRGDRYSAFGFATGYDRQGHVTGHGTALVLGTRIPPP